MTRSSPPCHFNSRFLAIAIGGSILIGLVCTFAPIFAQIAMIGCYLSVLSGLVFASLGQAEQFRVHSKLQDANFQIADLLARQSNVFEEYEKIVSGIARSLEIDDDLFRRFAMNQLSQLGKVSEDLGAGRIDFRETESWRLTYERILRSEEVKLYLSIAHVGSANYWQNEPGKQSIELNYKLQDEKGLRVERIFIISDTLWPKGQTEPSPLVFDWILEQYNHGIWSELVRESQLADEPELIVDTGIYGERATGIQFLDQESRSINYQLSFNKQDFSAAKKRWERLKLFSIPIRRILEP